MLFLFRNLRKMIKIKINTCKIKYGNYTETVKEKETITTTQEMHIA